MRLSDDKIYQLSSVILDHLDRAEDAGEEVILKAEDDEIRRRAREAMIAFLRKEHQLAEKVKKKIRTMKRNVPEGSAEWNAIYQQLYGEELDTLREVR